MLTARGERKANEPREHNGLASIERVTGTFARCFTLPDAAREAGITANHADGVLEVVIPKARRAEATRIAVKVN